MIEWWVLRARDYEIIAISCLDIPKEARGASNRGAHRRVVQVGRTQGCASGAHTGLCKWGAFSHIVFVDPCREYIICENYFQGAPRKENGKRPPPKIDSCIRPFRLEHTHTHKLDGIHTYSHLNYASFVSDTKREALREWGKRDRQADIFLV